LIGLLLNASTADVDARLTPDGRLQAGGLLRLDRDGDLEPLERLTSLLRRNVSPAADLHDQLLGTMTIEPLPWDAFTHLGPQAALAVLVVRAALDRRESGI